MSSAIFTDQTQMDQNKRNEIEVDSSLEDAIGSGPPSSEPMRMPVITLERDMFMSTMLSPKPSECPAEENKEKYNKSMKKCDLELRTPKKNSRCKVKTHSCKKCPFVATTKFDFWKHNRIHLRQDKILTCSKCPFVTEIKHHLEYHMRNHDGSKPYKCSQCVYSCVNISMLNSHKKSHSNVYQYRCADCKYATKFRHPLKLHLREKKHRQAVVPNADGTTNPSQIIDVYGTKRGPMLKPQIQKTSETATSYSEPVICSQATTQAVSQAFQATDEKEEEEGDECFTTMFDYVEVVHDMNHEDASNTVTNDGNQNNCQFCGLTFGDIIMYTIHMGYHGFNNPFTCNMSREECENMLSFQLLMARQSHM